MSDSPSIESMWRDMLTNRESPLYKKGRIFKHVPGDPRCRASAVSNPVLTTVIRV